MTQTVLLYGKASQQRMAPYIVISKRRLSAKAQAPKFVTGASSSPLPKKELNSPEEPEKVGFGLGLRTSVRLGLVLG